MSAIYRQVVLDSLEGPEASDGAEIRHCGGGTFEQLLAAVDPKQNYEVSGRELQKFAREIVNGAASKLPRFYQEYQPPWKYGSLTHIGESDVLEWMHEAGVVEAADENQYKRILACVVCLLDWPDFGQAAENVVREAMIGLIRWLASRSLENRRSRERFVTWIGNTDFPLELGEFLRDSEGFLPVVEEKLPGYRLWRDKHLAAVGIEPGPY